MHQRGLRGFVVSVQATQRLHLIEGHTLSMDDP
jgi:hypothetical protein